MRRQVRSVIPLCAVVAFLARLDAQSPTPFTAEDMQRVAAIQVLDVSDDGRRVAAAVRRQADNDVVDYRRFGDPTYLAPGRVAVQIFDTRTGAMDAPFKDLVNVRDAAWSRDGGRLALVLAREGDGPDRFPRTSLYVWDAAQKQLHEVPAKTAEPIAVNASLSWTPDGSSILVALRNADLDRDARARFKAVTEGPIIVHKSSDPFLEWDLLQRSARSRSLAMLDPVTGAVRAILPQGRLTSYQLARDGSFVTAMQDVTEKTDYDTIGGTDNNLVFVDARSGDSKIVAAGKGSQGNPAALVRRRAMVCLREEG